MASEIIELDECSHRLEHHPVQFFYASNLDHMAP